MADEPDEPAAPAPESPDDEKPNIPRIVALAVVLIALSGWLYYIRVVNPPPAHQTYADLPGIDVRGLSDTQMQALMKVANATDCGCGLNHCTMTLAECRHMDVGCHTSRTKLDLMVANLRAGKPITDGVDKIHVPVLSGHDGGMGPPMPGMSGMPGMPGMTGMSPAPATSGVPPAPRSESSIAPAPLTPGSAAPPSIRPQAGQHGAPVPVASGRPQ